MKKGPLGGALVLCLASMETGCLRDMTWTVKEFHKNTNNC